MSAGTQRCASCRTRGSGSPALHWRRSCSTARQASSSYARSRRSSPASCSRTCSGSPTGRCASRWSRNIINVNGADHGRLRKLVQPGASPRARPTRYRPAMREILARACGSRSRDAGSVRSRRGDFTQPYPARVIAAVMGAPARGRRPPARLVDVDPAAVRPDRARRSGAARRPSSDKVAEFYEWVAAADRSAAAVHPADDLISALITAEEEGDQPLRRRGREPRPQHPRGRRRHHARASSPMACGSSPTRPDQWAALRERS